MYLPEIIDKRFNRFIKNCETGTCFYYKNNLCMKISNIGDYSTAVMLSTGEMLNNIDCNALVQKVNVQIIVE